MRRRENENCKGQPADTGFDQYRQRLDATVIPAFGHWTLPSSKDALKCTTPVERGLQEAQAVGGKQHKCAWRGNSCSTAAQELDRKADKRDPLGKLSLWPLCNYQVDKWPREARG